MKKLTIMSAVLFSLLLGTNAFAAGKQIYMPAPQKQKPAIVRTHQKDVRVQRHAPVKVIRQAAVPVPAPVKQISRSDEAVAGALAIAAVGLSVAAIIAAVK